MNDVILIFLITTFGALTPGPAFVYVISYSLHAGFKKCLYITLGVATATFFLCGLTMLGLSQVMMAHTWAVILFKLLGGLWLIWLGIKAFRARHSLMLKAKESHDCFNPKNYFLGGFLLQVTNPKATIYWMASMSLIMLDKPSGNILILGMSTAMISSFIVYSAIALIFSGEKIRIMWKKAHRKIMVLLGTIYTFFGARLISEI